MSCNVLKVGGHPTRDEYSLLHDSGLFTGSFDEYRQMVVEHGECTAFLCGNTKVQTCQCGRHALYLCDYPVGDDLTCDKLLCEKCHNKAGEDIHYCGDHHREYLRWLQAKGADSSLMERHAKG